MNTAQIRQALDLSHFLTAHCPPELPIETRSESGDTREVLTAKIENRRLILIVGGPSTGITELEEEIEKLESEIEDKNFEIQRLRIKLNKIAEEANRV